MIYCDILCLSLYIHTEPRWFFPFSHGEVPYYVFAILMRISLYFTAEEIRWQKFNGSILPFTFIVLRDIVVHDVAATPTSKFAWLQKLKFVVSHLIIRYQHWSKPREPPFVVYRDTQVFVFSSNCLIRDAGKHPIVVVETSRWDNI